MPESTRLLKNLGQNFLTNPFYAEKIAGFIQPGAADVLIEIGPGRGALTRFLAGKKAAQRIGIEFDRRWAAELQQQFAGQVEIIEADFLQADLTTFGTDLFIIGNIPYNITSPILFKVLDAWPAVKQAVFMTQKEVAERIYAEPGSKIYGILSVLMQTYARAEKMLEVGAGNFFPKPKVDSAVFRLDFYSEVQGLTDHRLYRKIVRTAFNYRRKTLRNSLRTLFENAILDLVDSTDLSRRPETLSIDEFKQLTANLLKLKI